jgi:acyl-CoA reductase-like NAD-dependent aldehyde dehydrogenase
MWTTEENTLPTSPQDWRVTAYQEAHRAIAALNTANDEPPAPLDTPALTRAEILRLYRDATRAAEAAMGALVEAELRDGVSWAELADTLGFPDEWSARAALTRYREAGGRRLHDRLPRA